MPPVPSGAPDSPPRRLFPETLWEAVTWRKDAPAHHIDRAYAEICRTYWQPVLRLIRSLIQYPQEAEDIAQGFWVHILATGGLRSADPAKGRFRDYLAAAVRHYLGDWRDRARTQRRGGGAVHLSLDVPGAVPACALGSGGAQAPAASPGDEEWAEKIVAKALAQLEAQYTTPRQKALFAALRPSLCGEEGTRTSFEGLARQLGRRADSLRRAAARLRSELQRLVFGELTAQVGRERLPEESRNLREILRNRR